MLKNGEKRELLGNYDVFLVVISRVTVDFDDFYDEIANDDSEEDETHPETQNQRKSEFSGFEFAEIILGRIEQK